MLVLTAFEFDYDKERRIYTFSCRECGTTFEVDEQELKRDNYLHNILPLLQKHKEECCKRLQEVVRVKNISKIRKIRFKRNV